MKDVFMKVFSNTCIENFGKYLERRMHWKSILIQSQDYSLQPTTRLKASLQIIFWKCSERNESSKISKNRKSPL